MNEEARKFLGNSYKTAGREIFTFAVSREQGAEMR
jgi:hypothetical protein